MPLLSNTKSARFATTLELEALGRCARGDADTWVFLVPNRVAERRMEREMLIAANGHALPKLQILTLADLANELAAKAYPNFRYIGDSESAMLIELSIRELLADASLTFFERAAQQPSEAFPIPRGTFELVVNTIRQLKESGVAPEHLESDLLKSTLEGASTEVRRASDILRIYQSYHAKLVQSQLMDTYGQTLLVNERYAHSNDEHAIWNDFHAAFPHAEDIFIAGFYYLEPPSIKLISRLAQMPAVRVHIELPENKNNNELFSPLIELEALLRDAGFHAVPGMLPKRHPLANTIATQLFKPSENQSQTDAADAIAYLSTRDTLDEVEEIARQIQLLAESDLSLRNDLSQIAIATPSPEIYSPLIEEVFRRHEIAVQLTDRYRLDRSPFVQAVLSLLEISRTKFRRRELLRMLASPYFDCTRVCGAEFDAQNLLGLLARHAPMGHAGSSEQSLQLELLRVQSEKDSSDDSEAFDRATIQESHIQNALRDLAALRSALRPISSDLTPDEFCTALKALLLTLGTPDRLLESSETTIRTARLENDVRAYRTLLQLFDEMESLLRILGDGNEKRPALFYEQRIKAALIVTRYTTTPNPKAVQAMSLAQSISQPVKYLFIAGLSEGIFPTPYRPQIFLTGGLQKKEKRQLQEDRVLFYQAITNFSERLYLSYPTHSTKGAEENGSSFLFALNDILQIPAAPKAEGIFSWSDFYRSSSVATQPIDVLQSAYPHAGWLSLMLEQVPIARRATQSRMALERTIYRGIIDATLLTERERRSLESYKSRIWSISQLELYAQCHFRFFARDVLGLWEEESAKEGIDASERGSALHEILRQFLISRRERKLEQIQDVPESEMGTVYAEAHRVAEDYFASKSKGHPFWRLDAETLISEVQPSGNIIHKFIQRERELEPYELRPRFFEVRFGGKGRADSTPIDPELSTEDAVDLGGLMLRGKIDRIDIPKDRTPDDGTPGSFAVIDYKTGKKLPSFSEIDRGLSLQLPLYLRVAEDLLRAHYPELTGVAALYHTLGTDSERKLGLGLQPYSERAFEKLSKKKHAGLLGSKDDLSELIEQTVTKARSYVDGVAAGLFPLVEKKLIATCKHCPYHSVCRVAEAEQADVLQ